MDGRSLSIEEGLGNTVSLKELLLDLEGTLAEAVDGKGYAHYGYWPDGEPGAPTLQAMVAAQQAYFDLIATRIPDGTKTILDVGSGTGANAAGLIEHGYEVECLSPSEHLNALARGKLGDSTRVNDCAFEEFDVARTFDLCFFAESFHYIDLDTALAQLARYAEKHVMIFDYFRRYEKAGRKGTRGTHSEFRRSVEAQGVFEVVSDEDVTQAILPTFVVLDHLRTNLFGPFVERSRKKLARDYPFRARMIEWIFGRKLDKIGRKDDRAARFLEKAEYRFILLRRR